MPFEHLTDLLLPFLNHHQAMVFFHFHHSLEITHWLLLLELFIPATSKVISGWESTCDSTQSVQLYCAAIL